MLDSIGRGYFYQADRLNLIAADSLDIAAVRNPSVAMVAWDIDPEYISTLSPPTSIGDGPLSLRVAQDVHVVADLASPRTIDQQAQAAEKFLKIASLTSNVIEASTIEHAVASTESTSLVDLLLMANSSTGNASIYGIQAGAPDIPTVFDGQVLHPIIEDAKLLNRDSIVSDQPQVFGTVESTQERTGILTTDQTREGTDLWLVHPANGRIASAEVYPDWMEPRDVVEGMGTVPRLGQILDFDQHTTAYENVLISTSEWLSLLEPGINHDAYAYVVAMVYAREWSANESAPAEETETLLSLLLSGIAGQDTMNTQILSASVTSGNTERPQWIGIDGSIGLSASLVRAESWQLELISPTGAEYVVTTQDNINNPSRAFGVKEIVWDQEVASGLQESGQYTWRLTACDLPIFDEEELGNAVATGVIQVDLVAPFAELVLVTPGQPLVDGDDTDIAAPGTFKIRGIANDYSGPSVPSMNFDRLDISLVPVDTNGNPVGEVVHVDTLYEPVSEQSGFPDKPLLAVYDTSSFETDTQLRVTLTAFDLAGNTAESLPADGDVLNPLIDTADPLIDFYEVSYLNGSGMPVGLLLNDCAVPNVITSSTSIDGDGLLTIKADMSDNSVTGSAIGTINRVQIVVNDNVFESIQMPGGVTSRTAYDLSANLSLQALAQGSNTIKLRAFDSAGLVGESSSVCIDIDRPITAFSVTPRIVTPRPNGTHPSLIFSAHLQGDPSSARSYEITFEQSEDIGGQIQWNPIYYQGVISGDVPANQSGTITKSAIASKLHLDSAHTEDAPDGDNYRAVLTYYNNVGSPIAYAYARFGLDRQQSLVAIITDPSPPPASPDGDTQSFEDYIESPTDTITTSTLDVYGYIYDTEQSPGDIYYTLRLTRIESSYDADATSSAKKLLSTKPDASGGVHNWTSVIDVGDANVAPIHNPGDPELLLGVLDLTSLPNGSYDLELVASKTEQALNDLPAHDKRRINIAAGAKVGEFTFSQEDAGPKIGTLPVSLVRTYNSNHQDSASPFGPGWSMSLFDLDVEVDGNRYPVDLYDGGSGDFTIRDDVNTFNRNVTLTLPDGRRTTFTFKLSDAFAGGVAHVRYQAQFQSPTGVLEKLIPWDRSGNDTPMLRVGGLVTSDMYWECNNCGLVHDQYFDIPRYELVSPDGTRYTILRDKEISPIGSVLDIGREVHLDPYLDTISLPTGQAIKVLRDAELQVTGAAVSLDGVPQDEMFKLIWDDVDGSRRVRAMIVLDEVYYAYNYTTDMNGDRRLSEVVRLTKSLGLNNPDDAEVLSAIDGLTGADGDFTTFEYDQDMDYRLESIIDPRGVPVLQAGYDSSGRMISTADAFGEKATIDHDIENRKETVTERGTPGRITTYTYDDNGNVIEEELPGGFKVGRTYRMDGEIATGLVESETRISAAGVGADSATTSYEYDNKYNQTKVVDPQGGITRTAYLYYGGSAVPAAVGTVTGNTLGAVSASIQRFDRKGNLVRTSSFPGTDVNMSINDNSLDGDEFSDAFFSQYGSIGSEPSNAQVTQYEYDEYSRIVTIIPHGDVAIDDDGIPGVNSSHITGSTEYEYNENIAYGNRPKSIKRYGDNAELTSYQVFDYDTQYRQTATGTATPVETTMGTKYRVVASFTEYDFVGREVASAKYEGSTLHDDLDTAVSSIDFGSITPSSETSKVYYDGSDQVVVSVDRESKRTLATLRDARGDVIETVEWNMDIEEDLSSIHRDQFVEWYSKAEKNDFPDIDFPSVPDTPIYAIAERTSYDKAGRPIYNTDRVAIAASDYPSMINVEPGGTQTMYDSAGRVFQVRRFETLKIEFVSHEMNTTLRTTLSTHSMDGTTQSYTSYDNFGRVEWSQDAAGNRTSYTYDKNNRQKTVTQESNGSGSSLTTSYKYDGAGRVSEVTDPIGVKTSYEYDAQGRRTHTHFDDPDLSDANVGPSTISTSYDIRGRRTSETNQLNQVRRYVYDEEDRLRVVVLPDPVTGAVPTGAIDPVNPTIPSGNPYYQYTYNDRGNINKIETPNDGLGSVSNTTLKYDHLDRQIERTLPGNRSEQWRFASDESNVDGAYNALWLYKDFAGNITRYVYDENNREKERHYYLYDSPSGPVGTLDITTANEQSAVLPSVTAEIKHATTYDALGRVFQVVTTEGGVSETIEYAYYPSTGRLQSITQGNRGMVSYMYHPDGRVKSIVTNVDSDEKVTEYAYDFANRLQQVTAGGIGTWDYTYTKLGRRQSVTYNPESVAENEVVTNYSYDRLGRLTKLTNLVDDLLSTEFEYTLRADGRRTNVIERAPSVSDVNIEYTYDHLNRLTLEDYGNTSTGYAYSLYGNRLSKNTYDSNGTATYTVDYDYSSTADPDWLETETHNDLADSSNNKVITYDRDANGFLIHKMTSYNSGDPNDDELYTANAMGRLKTHVKDSVTTNYRYDHRGIQTQVWTATASQYHLIDSLNPTGYAQRAITHTTGNTIRRVFGDDLLYETGTQTHHLLYDGQGTTRELIDDTGTSIASYDFDAYGEPREGTSLTNPRTVHLYTGEARDEATGWTYLRARYLDTSTGTFNRSDPFFGKLSDPQSLHKYAYVHADPVNAWDPSGLLATTQTALVSTFQAALLQIKAFAIRSAIRVGISALTGGIFGQLTTGNALGGFIVGLQIGIVFAALPTLLLKDRIGILVAGFAAAILEIIIIYLEQKRNQIGTSGELFYRPVQAFAEGAYDALLDHWIGNDVFSSRGSALFLLQKVWIPIRELITVVNSGANPSETRGRVTGAILASILFSVLSFVPVAKANAAIALRLGRIFLLLGLDTALIIRIQADSLVDVVRQVPDLAEDFALFLDDYSTEIVEYISGVVYQSFHRYINDRVTN